MLSPLNLCVPSSPTSWKGALSQEWGCMSMQIEGGGNRILRPARRSAFASPVVVLQLQKLLLVSGLQKTMCFPVVGDSRMYAASDSMVSRRRRCCNFVHRSVT